MPLTLEQIDAQRLPFEDFWINKCSWAREDPYDQLLWNGRNYEDPDVQRSWSVWLACAEACSEAEALRAPAIDPRIPPWSLMRGPGEHRSATQVLIDEAVLREIMSPPKPIHLCLSCGKALNLAPVSDSKE